MSTRRKIAIIAAIIAGLALVPIGFHFYLRWDCARHRAELARKGEKLKIQEIAPVVPLAAENGAPALRNALALMPTFSTSNLVTDLSRTMTQIAPGRALVNWQQPELWRNSGETNSWEELRAELERCVPAIEQMRLALTNRAFDFNLNYAQGMTLRLPHLARLKTASQVLKSSAILHLHDQKFELALRNLNALAAMAGVLEKEPVMISQLVRIALSALAVPPTWEALQADGWTDAQLAELQKRWAEQRFIEPYLAALIMERAAVLQVFDQCRDSYTHYRSVLGAFMVGDDSDNPLPVMVEQIQIWTWPVFGTYQNERTYLDISQIGIDALREATTNAPYATARKNMNSSWAALGLLGDPFDLEDSTPSWKGSSIDRFFAQDAVDLLSSIRRPFTAEAQARLITTAIALKRYELRHGKLPEDLLALIPEFLATIPRDPMNGEPLHYRPNTNATFLLYSVGVDGDDNGGDATHLEGPLNSWLSGRDWVWPQPVSAEEVEQYNRRMLEARKKAEQKQRGGRKAPPP